MYYNTLGAADLVEIRTPGMAMSEMETINAAIQQLLVDQDTARKSVPGFDAFAIEWRTFYESNKAGPGAWLARGTTGTYNKILEFRNRTIDWRGLIDKAGIKTTGPYLSKSEPKTILGFKPIIALAIFGGAAAGIYYLWRQR